MLFSFCHPKRKILIKSRPPVTDKDGKKKVDFIPEELLKVNSKFTDAKLMHDCS